MSIKYLIDLWFKWSCEQLSEWIMIWVVVNKRETENPIKDWSSKIVIKIYLTIDNVIDQSRMIYW